ncbi:tripartite tricarboxylate transporter TctB family protein [Saccharopolyspora erythraea]|uniref:tripartite tricarboxylate transporter TctB family protein n=1 Tax=Saccharopolyspora erythraea TaxID=1836 RepID=UPI001BAD7EDB|nr:tripartite tricarboxylate transporter TctB family protein [Saccharopolyspora erythraea]QUH00560.1 tripartite tricarboxylate transporter TctB family protein [Saccharopolyspora erythraea]
MSTTELQPAAEPRRARRGWLKEHSELGICVVLAALGVLVLVDAWTIATDFTQRGPVGPKTVPYLVGGLLLLVSVLLARDVLRGGRGQSESGEDVDLSAPSDWRTVLLLSAAFLANAVLINVIGFPLSGMILFWGCAYALGSRNTVRDPLVAAVLSVLTYLVFNHLLGVPLPGGPLMGVL